MTLTQAHSLTPGALVSIQGHNCRLVRQAAQCFLPGWIVEWEHYGREFVPLTGFAYAEVVDG